MTFKFTSNLSFPQHKKTLTYCRAVSSPALDIPSPALPAANHLCHPGWWWDLVLPTWSLLRFPSKSTEILLSVWIWARLGLFFFFFLLSSAPGDPHSSSPDVHNHSAVAEVHSEVAEVDMEPSKGASFTHHHVWWFLSVVSGEAEGGRRERSCIKPQDNWAWKLFFHWFSKKQFFFLHQQQFREYLPPSPRSHTRF